MVADTKQQTDLSLSPIIQMNKNKNATIYRIFFLINITDKKVVNDDMMLHIILNYLSARMNDGSELTIEPLLNYFYINSY